MRMKTKKRSPNTGEKREVKFHYEPDVDIMYITREPHRFSSYCLEFGDNVRVMVDKNLKKVLGLVFLNYYEFIPQFFRKKSFRSKKCRDCESQKECFATNIRTLLESEIILKEVKTNKKTAIVESDLPEKIKELPTKSFACV